jgi:hypothetical protein
VDSGKGAAWRCGAATLNELRRLWKVRGVLNTDITSDSLSTLLDTPIVIIRSDSHSYIQYNGHSDVQ